MGETFAGIATSGPLVLALGVAMLAGSVSFLSPCVLPLVPGYVSYVTGMAGADVTSSATGTGSAVAVAPSRAGRARMLAGTLLFVAGFTVVFILTAVVVAGAGRLLLSTRARWRSSRGS